MPLGSGKCKSKARLDRKTAVVTGCNTGIGKETVKDFYKRGCRVIMACRDVSKAEEAAKAIRKETEMDKDIGAIVVVRLDLSSFNSIRQCAEELLRTEKQINLLINNAGVMLCPKGLTEDGFETQFGTNHLGHFLFTLLLLPLIRKSTPARIVTVSSLAHDQGSNINFDDLNWEKKYNPRLAYGQSKLANVLFSAELANRLKAAGIKDINTYSLHPGVVDTDLGRHLDSAYFSGVQWMLKNVVSRAIKTPLQGAQTSIYCAVDEKAANETGLYYSDCLVKKASSKGRDPALAKRLWDESIKMTGLQTYDPFTADVTPAPKLLEKVLNEVKEVKEVKKVKEAKEVKEVVEDIEVKADNEVKDAKVVIEVKEVNEVKVVKVVTEVKEVKEVEKSTSSESAAGEESLFAIPQKREVKVKIDPNLTDLEVMGISEAMLESAAIKDASLEVYDVKKHGDVRNIKLSVSSDDE